MSSGVGSVSWRGETLTSAYAAFSLTFVKPFSAWSRGSQASTFILAPGGGGDFSILLLQLLAGCR